MTSQRFWDQMYGLTQAQIDNAEDWGKSRIKKDADSLKKRERGFLNGKKYLKDFIIITAGEFLYFL